MTHQFRIFDGLRSRSAISLLLIVTLTLNSSAQNTESKPRTVTLRRGQVLEMKLAKRVNSGRAKVGDVVVLRLKKPLLADGVTVLPAGWPVHGRITDVKRAAKHCQPGSIHWELEPLTMPDGKKIEIQSIAEDVARSRLLDQVPHDTGSPDAGGKAGGKSGEKTTRKTPKTGSSVGGVIKNIALGIVSVPLVILMFPLYVRAESEESCPGGKGREASVWAGRAPYAEISNDVQQVVQ
jgi:hypothetical protein